MKKTTLILSGLIISTFLVGNAGAVVPDLIPVQGVLADDLGNPLDGTFDVEFRLYATEAAASAEWTEIRDGGNQVEVSNGFFTVYLGDITPLDFATLAAHDELWLGMTVGADAEMNRMQLGAVPYAQECRQVGSLAEEDIQPVLSDGNACAAGTFLQGWDASLGAPICEAASGRANYITVAKSGGQFDTIQAALDSITDASDTNRYTVHVAPGVYAEAVTMKQYVDIEGSGVNTTKIEFAGGDTGTVVGASDAELRFLSVHSTGGGTDSRGIMAVNTNLELLHVDVVAEGGTSFNRAIWLEQGAPKLTHVYARGTGTSGIAWGIYCTDSTPTLIGVDAIGAGATTNWGMIVVNGSSADIRDSKFTQLNGVGAALSVSESGAAAFAEVHSSQFWGATEALRTTDTATISVFGSKLDGTVGGTGTINCAGVYSGSYVFYASTCP